MGHSNFDPVDTGPAWNAGRKLGAKRPLKPKEIWAIRFMLDQTREVRDRALFDLAIDSKLRGCDLVKVRIGDLVGAAASAIVRWLFNRRQRGRCSLNCWSQRGRQFWLGSSGVAEALMNSRFPAELIAPIT